VQRILWGVGCGQGGNLAVDEGQGRLEKGKENRGVQKARIAA